VRLDATEFGLLAANRSITGYQRTELLLIREEGQSLFVLDDPESDSGGCEVAVIGCVMYNRML